MRFLDTNILVYAASRQDVEKRDVAGHHSVIRVGDDDWRICYHRRPIPNEGPHHRVVCIDRMAFDADGNIKPVEMTK